MPIVVNPSFVWPPETEPVVSPDGRITAIVDPAHAGVLLRADYSDQGDSTPVENLWLGSKMSADRSAVSTNSWNTAVEQTDEGLEITIGGADNSSSVSVSYTNGGYRVPMEPGLPYSFSVPIKNTGDVAFSTKVAFYLTSGGIYPDPVVIQPGEVHVFKAEQAVLADGGDLRWSLRYDAGAVVPPDGSKITLLDGATCIQSERVTELFNGDTADSETKAYSWTGPAGNSTSLASPIHSRLVSRVRFERQDGTVVRSGNPAWAPGGYAHAYDHEATLGGGTLWRAVPIHFDGTEGTPSEYVGAVIPALSDGWAWLKPVSDPNKSMLLKVEPPDLSYDGRVDTTSIAGASRPAATWDVLEGFTTQLRSLVREKSVADQLMALLDEGPVLAQFPACAGLPDFYFIRGKVDLEHVHWDGYPWRRYQWDVISIDRPDTTDSPLRIPDLSYDTVERDWTTYDQLKSTVVSYNKLLEP